MILKQLKGKWSKYSNQKIKDIVITVPVYFNQNQRNLTTKAGNISSFENIDITNLLMDLIIKIIKFVFLI